MHIIAWFDNLLSDISINTFRVAYILSQDPQSVDRALLELNGTRYGGECLRRGYIWNMHYIHNHVYEEFCEAYNQGQAVELYVYNL